MGKDDEIDDEFLPQVGELWTVLEILDRATSIDDVEIWVENQNDIHHEKFAPGYLLFLETGVRRLVQAAENNTDLYLESDYRTERALSELADLSKVPHSTEKLAFYRNLKKIQSELRSISPTRNDYGYLVEARDAISPLIDVKPQIRAEVGQVDSDLDFNQVNDDMVLLTLFTWFLDCENNQPRGYGFTNLPIWVSSGPRENSILGYSVTLQFLLYQILSEEQYVELGIEEISESDRWSPRDIWELNELGLDEEPLDCLRDNYVELKEDLIEPIDEKYAKYEGGLQLTPDNLFQLNSDGTLKAQFSELLEVEDSVQVSDLAPKDRVAFALNWSRQVEWLGSASFSKIPLLRTTLLGLMKSYSTYEEEVPIHFVRFNHPVAKGENLVSYGVLQRVPPGALGDASGWLIFSRCAADYEISGSAKIDSIGAIVEYVDRHNPVIRTEVTVGLDEFKDEISGRLADDYLEKWISNQNLEDALGLARGVITELATVYVQFKTPEVNEIEWARTDSGEEVDLIVERGDEVVLIECKADIDTNGVSKAVSQISRKVTSYDGNWDSIRGEIWVWEDPSDHARRKAQESGFKIQWLQEKKQIQQASTADLNEVFSTFNEERTNQDLFSPSERF